MEAARRNEQEMGLRMLREFAGMTQEEVASELELPQSAISRFENRTDPKVSTLQRYVGALGGHLEVTAVIGDRRIVLSGFNEAE
jgi:transcriptional regulator with XRE-family HTH domain